MRRIQVDPTPLIDQIGGWTAGNRVGGAWLPIAEWSPDAILLTVTLGPATDCVIDFNVRPYGESAKEFRVRSPQAVGDLTALINADGDYCIPLELPNGAKIVAHEFRIGVRFNTAVSAGTFARARLIKSQEN